MTPPKLLVPVILLFILSFTSLASACTYPPFGVGIGGWPACQTVTVYIDSGFSQVERDAIMATFHEWIDPLNLGTAYSGTVIFVFSEDTNRHTFLGFAPNTEDQHIYQIIHSQPPGDHAPAAGFTGPTLQTPRIWAWTYINPIYYNPSTAEGIAFLKRTLAHEIGHSFSLDECWLCSSGNSIMVALGDLPVPQQLLVVDDLRAIYVAAHRSAPL